MVEAKNRASLQLLYEWMGVLVCPEAIYDDKQQNSERIKILFLITGAKNTSNLLSF